MYSQYKSSLTGRVPPEFGSAMRNEEFNLQPGVAFCNQGSYGYVPKRVAEEKRRMEGEMESDFESWTRIDRSSAYEEARLSAAQFLGADVGNLALEENATRSINNVMTSITWSSGDVILLNSVEYGANVSLVDRIIERHEGVSKQVIPIPTEIESEEQIIQLYQDALQGNANIRLVMIDHIASVPAAVFPVKELVALCHQYSALVLIDGAHCPGQLDLNLEELGADFYIGNLHKWSYSFRGCAVLHVAPQHHDMVTPIITTFDYGDPFPENHEFQGTNMPTHLLSATAAVEFYNWIGGSEAIRAYVTPLLSAAVDTIIQEVGASRYPIPSSMECPFLRNVRLPPIEGFDGVQTQDVMIYTRQRYNVWTAFFRRPESEDLYIRVSGGVYCTAQDYQELADALKDMVENGVDPQLMKSIQEKAYKSI